MAFPATLVTNGKDNPCIPAGPSDYPAVGDRIGNGLIYKNMFAGLGCEARGLPMDVIRGGDEDPFDGRVLKVVSGGVVFVSC